MKPLKHPNLCLSICLSMDRIIPPLYLLQYWSNPFNFFTSYQPTWEGMLQVEFLKNFLDFIFSHFFFYFRLLDLVYNLEHPWWACDLWFHPWSWPWLVYFSPSWRCPRLHCSQPNLVVNEMTEIQWVNVLTLIMTASSGACYTKIFQFSPQIFQNHNFLIFPWY